MKSTNYICSDGKKLFIQTKEEIDAEIRETEENPNHEMSYTVVCRLKEGEEMDQVIELLKLKP